MQSAIQSIDHLSELINEINSSNNSFADLKRARHTETVAENRVTAAKEVCDVITTQLKDRFAVRDIKQIFMNTIFKLLHNVTLISMSANEEQN
jgi:hypothetical protein